MGSLVKSGLLSSVAQAVPSSTTQPMPIDPMEAMYINTFGFNPFPKYGFNSYMDYNTARTTGTPMNQNISDLEDYLGTLESAREINLPGVTKDLSAEDISRLRDEYVKKMASTSNALNPTVTASTPTSTPNYREQALSEMLSRYNVGSLSDIKNFNYLLPGYKDKNNLNVRTFETRDPLLAVDRRAQQLENAAARTSVNMQGYRPGAMDGGIISTRIGYKDAGMVSPTDSDEEGIGGVIYQDEDGNIISKKEAMKLFKKQAEEEEKEKKNKKADDTVDYKEETKKKTKREKKLGSDSFVDKIFTDEEGSLRYPVQLMRKIGEDLFFFGEPNPTLRYNEFDKMSPEYQDRVETRREEDRRYFQEPENYSLYREGRVPRYDFYGVQNKADGGIINLMGGGMPSIEMDYRGGGFIPVGAKERADDVPARLSKNEFVMTADAVRAAGGGSVDEGARRMYQLMDALEGRKR
jgi:hypothetical protein